MRLAVADTGPLNYLILIDAIESAGRLLGAVSIPAEVHDELAHPRAPALVRAWIASPPAWLRMHARSPEILDTGLARLDPGERAAIALALAVGADVVLMDDRSGVAAARERGLPVIGTLGLLQRAARHGLLDLSDALGRLVATNFRVRPELIDALLAETKTSR